MFESIKQGMTNTRSRFTEQMNVLLGRGPQVDEEFWEGLEEALILADVGAQAAFDIVNRMRDKATRKALPDAYAVMDNLTDEIAATFATADVNVFDEDPVLILFVGINGAGKTTTVGKIAAAAQRAGRKVLLGSADTFRAAAIEQLAEWATRSGSDIVQRERGADPASVCYDTIERAEETGANFILIDTAGRLHTSDDLMRELEKVVNVVRKRSTIPVRTVLVIDATTGQNGLSQARLFNNALDLDALIVTKLDGTAKGGIALAVSHELQLPIAMIGVGEGINDLQLFDPEDFAAALIGAEPVELGSAVLPNGGQADAADTSEAASGNDFASAAPLLEVSESAEPDSDTSSCASLPHAFNKAASQPSRNGVQTDAAPFPDAASSVGANLAEPIGDDNARAANLAEPINLADSSTTSDSPAQPVGNSGSEEVIPTDGVQDREFSWKDDFGNPDEMVDALGAQRTLEVVVDADTDTDAEANVSADTDAEADTDTSIDIDTDTSTDTSTDADTDVVNPSGEQQQKQSVFKRAWKWLSE